MTLDLYDNPFWNRDAITDSDFFIGRTRELRQLFAMLRHTQSFSIVGERRIGKSSLLKYITNPTIRVENGFPLEKTVFIYLDFEGKLELTPVQFWKLILEDIVSNLKIQDVVESARGLLRQDSLTHLEIEAVLQKASDSGIKIIMAFDEFEMVALNKHLDWKFFGGLRSLANSYEISYVTSSRVGLLDLHYSNDVVGSPFFNIFTQLKLGAFSRKDLSNLLHQYLAGKKIIFNSEDENLILDFAGLFPFFAQILCYHLYDVFETEEISHSRAELHRQAIRYYESEAEPHFKYYWNNAEDMEKAALVLLTLSRLGNTSRFSVNKISDYIMRDVLSLAERGLAIETDSGFVLFSEAFARWIMKELAFTANKSQFEDFDQWLESIERKSLPGKTKDIIIKSKDVFSKIDPKYWKILLTVTSQMQGLDFLKNFL